MHYNTGITLDTIPNLEYLDGYDGWKIYGSGNLPKGWYYRINSGRKHKRICWIYDENNTEKYNCRLEDEENYYKLQSKLLKILR